MVLKSIKTLFTSLKCVSASVGRILEDAEGRKFASIIRRVLCVLEREGQLGAKRQETSYSRKTI